MQADIGIGGGSFEQTLKLRPKDPLIWHSYGVVQCLQQDYTAALDSYDRAIAIDPNFYEAWYERGNALATLERAGGRLQCNFKKCLSDFCPGKEAALGIIVVNMILSLILFDKKN